MRGFATGIVLVLASVAGGGALGAPAASAASTGNSAKQTGYVVSQEPAKTTPNILDGTVNSITQVGSKIIVGGSFTKVRNPNRSAVITRNHLLAFDAATGVVSTTFNPGPDGIVKKVQAAADGRSVFVGGHFSHAGGRATKYLFRANATSGAVSAGFRPAALDGDVRDIEVVGGRLWVAGKFSHVGGRARKALATLSASTGAYNAFYTGSIAGRHNPTMTKSVTDVLQISTNRANNQLVAVGNFTSVNGQARSQIMKLNIGGRKAALSPWRTNFYTQPCSKKFDTYMTDVEFSPNGLYFVVSTVGSYGANGSSTGTSGCDVVSRFQSSTSTLAKPVWTAYPGGDSTWTAEVTDNAVYVGGHQRWQNNPTVSNKAGQGAVTRTGIAALDPINGLPYSWNPTRTRGVGVQDMMATNSGLYVGSDTTLIGKTSGNTYHARIALMPLKGGKKLASIAANKLPADVYTVARGSSQLVRRTFTGAKVTGTANAPSGPGWSKTVGAFMINGSLYTATSNGVVSKRSFNGSRYGSASTVDAADQLVRQTDWHNGDVPKLQSLFYDNGRMFFTLAGQNVLYQRGFEAEDGVVGQLRAGSPAPKGVTYSTMYGAFVAGGRLYYANTSGRLIRAGWSGVGAVGGSAVQVSGPGKDAQNWASKVMFPRQ